MGQKEIGQDEVRATVVLHGIDVAILRQVEKDQGVSRSAAVRMLIRQAGGISDRDCETSSETED